MLGNSLDKLSVNHVQHYRCRQVRIQKLPRGGYRKSRLRGGAELAAAVSFRRRKFRIFRSGKCKENTRRRKNFNVRRRGGLSALHRSHTEFLE